MAGAGCFAWCVDGQPLYTWPPETTGIHGDTVAPVRRAGRVIGELWVDGLSGPAALARLTAEADLIGQLAQADCELEEVTSELVNTQDQLLALYNLTRAYRDYQSRGDALSVQNLLDRVTFEVQYLTKTQAVLAWVNDQQGNSYRALSPSRPFKAGPLIEYCTARLAEGNSPGRKVIHNARDGDESLPSGVHSLLFEPVYIREMQDAGLMLINHPQKCFTAPDLKLARAIGEQIGAQVENILLQQSTIERTRLHTEMELARSVQNRLMPPSTLEMPGLSVIARSRPALQVGGDFCELIPQAGDRLTLCVGDVSGKGMPAALVMAMSHTVARSAAQFMPDPTPQRVLQRFSDNLYDDLTQLGSMVTLFVGTYSARDRQLACANAGHAPVIYRPFDGRAVLLEADCPPVGVIRDCAAPGCLLTLRPGDVLVAATDGFSEAHDASETMFGIERLLQLVDRVATRPTAEMLDALFGAVDAFAGDHHQSDDQTVVVVKGLPNGDGETPAPR